MIRFLALCASLVAWPAAAKPIAFGDGTTLMAEFGAGTMVEVQGYYAPRYWWSAGGGFLHLENEAGTLSRDIGYARANLLVHRWNLPSAQANVFAWAGAGYAHASGVADESLAGNAGLQADYETRRVYGSLRSDWHGSRHFAHRIDTLQLGVAPYVHDWDRLATWIVVQARTFTGGLYDGVEPALLVRLFKGPVWLEAGISGDGKLQSMLMLNF
jgi:hypothetical protein